MLRLLSALLLVIIVPGSGFCQDTIFVVKPKYAIVDTEVFFSGDTALVRFLFDYHNTSIKVGSTAFWYTKGKPVLQADLATIGFNSLFGTKRFGDSIYYYADGTKDKIAVYASAGLGATDSAIKFPYKGDQHLLTYAYLQGEPGSGFKLLTQRSNFMRIRMDELENKVQAMGDVDYMAHFVGKNMWVSVFSLTKTTGRSVAVFSKKP